MSTKNLSRTVIEGGRAHGQRVDERFRHRSERAEARTKLKRIWTDDDDPIIERRKETHRGDRAFRDNLRPMYRFLQSNIGSKWDHINSDVRFTFDDRNLASAHILFDHLLSSVKPYYHKDADYEYFIVDENGVLQDNGYARGRRRYYYQDPAWKALYEWVGKRKVVKHVYGNKKTYWYDLTPSKEAVWTSCWDKECQKANPRVTHSAMANHPESVNVGYHEHPTYPLSYQMKEALNKEELVFYNKLDNDKQTAIGYYPSGYIYRVT